MYLVGRLPEDVADELKRVRVLTLHEILLIYVCCTFVGLDNKLHNMQGTYIKKLHYIFH
jgi:hypothetical protein